MSEAFAIETKMMTVANCVDFLSKTVGFSKDEAQNYWYDEARKTGYVTDGDEIRVAIPFRQFLSPAPDAD